MNTLKQTSKLWLPVLLVAILGSPAMSANDEGTENHPYVILADLELEIFEPFLGIEGEEIQIITYEFYDKSDKLIFKTTLNNTENPGKELIKYMNESDYLTEYANTSYFRLSR